MKRSIYILILMIACLYGEAQSVYKTPSGKKYHLATCRSVKNVSEKITLQEALEAGLEACKICKPKQESAFASPIKKTEGTAKGVQCKGYTKSGTRCKHFTKIGNGYCFQHQPD